MEEIYYIYHIPNKKIGVTRDLNNRVTLVQGYKPGEYEVLDSSSDINYISTREIELQKFYGYKVDRTLYKNLFKSNTSVVIYLNPSYRYVIGDIIPVIISEDIFINPTKIPITILTTGRKVKNFFWYVYEKSQ